MSGDWPDIPFLQAEKYRQGRPDGPPLWIVWHTMEEDELPNTAEAVANYFAFNTGVRDVSSHYCIDANSAVQCVRLADSAWTVGNRPGNHRGINYELAGYASQRAAGWQDSYSTRMLRRAAAIAARDMRRYNIPARWCTVRDLRARKPGLTTHTDLRVAFGGTTHTDPGAHFPRARVLDWIIGEDDDMALTDRVDMVDEDSGDRWSFGQIIGRDDITVNAALGYAAASDHRIRKQVLPRLAAIAAAVSGQDVESVVRAELAQSRQLEAAERAEEWATRVAGLSAAVADRVIEILAPGIAAAVADEIDADTIRTQIRIAIQELVGAPPAPAEVLDAEIEGR